MRGLTRIIFVHFLIAVVTSQSVGLAGDFMQNETECGGSIAECSLSSEFEMDSEINRRILQTTQNKISYDALQANSVPCSVAGESYYNNCQRGAQVNSYTRGCSTATRCNRG